MEKRKIPKRLQPTLWSVNVKKLNLERNREYIINQVLAFGGIRDWKWLFNVYKQKTIKKIFLEKPMKAYRMPTFNLVRHFLDLENKKLIKEKYVVNTPRIIG